MGTLGFVAKKEEIMMFQYVGRYMHTFISILIIDVLVYYLHTSFNGNNGMSRYLPFGRQLTKYIM